MYHKNFVLEPESNLKHQFSYLCLLVSVHKPPATFDKVNPQVVSLALFNLLKKNTDFILHHKISPFFILQHHASF